MGIYTVPARFLIHVISRWIGRDQKTNAGRGQNTEPGRGATFGGPAQGGARRLLPHPATVPPFPGATAGVGELRGGGTHP